LDMGFSAYYSRQISGFLATKNQNLNSGNL